MPSARADIGKEQLGTLPLVFLTIGGGGCCCCMLLLTRRRRRQNGPTLRAPIVDEGGVAIALAPLEGLPPSPFSRHNK